ncbi:nitrogen fixation protein FixH [Pseudoxanthomonas broegbernensis]|uniref:Nitrogen fixation protein FixH n=1 Tax=Pseudoxanthomonas broegbernensis TaxID=83619 RepID=A0A7V8GNF6_9GAMM|nr:FixH family protein [Pseudoxanthomonas broegbernensis]KAF1687125.1 nitrogen fixation protein FixH [Pseudoxanthomonas broegbernensis]MBB6065899.1 hypothetical protein [Pseudoxanthomonas broegbernensis]
MTDDRSPETASSPWRQPIVWLVIALVAASVIGGVVMVTVAGRDGPMDAVPDRVQRTGQVQQSDLGPDARAAELDLSAIVRVDREAGVVEALPVTGRFDRAAPLALRLHHPLRAAEDLSLRLQPTDTGWRAEAALDLGHDWLLQLGPDDGGWRLRGRLPRGQLAARADPAVGGESPDDAPDAPAP